MNILDIAHESTHRHIIVQHSYTKPVLLNVFWVNNVLSSQNADFLPSGAKILFFEGQTAKNENFQKKNFECFFRPKMT